MFIRSRVLQDGTDMDSALVSEGTAAYERLLVSKRQVRQLSHKLRSRGEMSELVRSNGCMPQLQLEIGEHGTQVSVAAALTIAIEAALDVGGSGLDGHNRIRYRYFGVVMAVNSKDYVEPRANVPYDFGQPMR